MDFELWILILWIVIGDRQIRIPRTFLLQKESFLGKNRIFATFRFNIQAFPESGKRFSLRKCQIRTFLPLEGSFLEKIFTWVPTIV